MVSEYVYGLPDIVQAGIVFLGLLLGFGAVIAWWFAQNTKKLEKETNEYLKDSFEMMMDEAQDTFRTGVVDQGVEYVVLPTKAVYDVLGVYMAGFLYFVIRAYQEKFGEINVDKDGNRFEVMVRGKDGRFIR